MRSIKRTLFAIALAILLVSLSAISVFAGSEPASETPTVAINSFALNLGDAVHIKVTASGENLPDNAKIQILVWDAPQTDYTINSENAPVIVNPYGVNEKTGRTEFYYTKVSAKEMTKNFYFVACVNCNGEYIYSSVQKHSVLQYAYTQSSLTSNTNLKNLLSAMLEYGAWAQTYFGYSTDRLANDTYYQIGVVGGTLEDGQKLGLFASKETPTIIAAEPAIGYEFLGWTNSNGTTISSNLIYTLPCVSATDVYTAQYEELPRIEPTDSSYFNFITLDDGTYAIAAAEGVTLPAELVIPAYYNDVKVTAIAEAGFAAHNEIKSVRFEYTNILETIGNGAFAGCTNILTFLVPSNVSEIGDLAFDGCYRLVEVYNYSDLDITAGSASNGKIASVALDVYTDKNAQTKLSKLADGCIVRCDSGSATIVAFDSSADALVLPDTINNCYYTINAYAFAGNTTLKSLDVGTCLTAISEYAFKDSIALRSVVIIPSDHIATVANNAFDGCINFRSIYLSNSISAIGADAFRGCSALTIFTSFAAKPTGWNQNWNSSDCTVIWDYKAPETDTPLVPVKRDENN